MTIRDMQTKTIMIYHFTPTEWLKWKRVTIPSVGKDMEQLNLLYMASGNVKLKPQPDTTAHPLQWLQWKRKDWQGQGLMRVWREWNSPTLLIRNSLPIYHNLHIHTAYHLAITLSVFSKRNEHIYPHKDLLMDIHSSFIYGNQKLETIQLSAREWLKRQCSRNSRIFLVLLSNKMLTHTHTHTHHIWISNTCQMKEAKEKRVHSVRFHL